MSRIVLMFVLGLIVATASAGCGPSGAAPAKPAAEPSKPAAAAPPPQAAPTAPAPQPPAAKPAAPAQAPAPKPAPEKAPVVPTRVLMGTAPTASSFYAYFVSVSKIINGKVPELNVTVVETGGSVENATRISSGEFAFGSVNPDYAYRAYHGLEQRFKDQPFKNIRTLWLVTVSPTAWVVRVDSGVRVPTDLEGKDFNPGFRGSATESQTRKALEVLGIKPRFHMADLADAAAAFKDRRVVGLVKTFIGLTPDASLLDLKAATAVRLLSFTKDQIAKIEEAAPWYGHVEIPARVFANDEPVLTLTLVQGTHTTTALDEAVAYKIAKAIFEDNKLKGEGSQGQAMSAVKDLDFQKLTIEQAKVPLHKGTLKYLKEIGVSVPQALIPPEAN